MIVYAVMREGRDADALAHILADRDRAVELASWLAHEGHDGHYVIAYDADTGGRCEPDTGNRGEGRTVAAFNGFDTKFRPVRTVVKGEDGYPDDVFLNYFTPDFTAALGMAGNTGYRACQRISAAVAAGHTAGTDTETADHWWPVRVTDRVTEWAVLPMRPVPARPTWLPGERK